MNAAQVRRSLSLGMAIFLSYAYFYPGGGWNQNSRFDMVRALLEGHTLRIDAYQENTGDKALSNGHFYSDKAPGLALLALPMAAATRPVLRAVGVDPASPVGLVAISYFASLFAVALPTALACVCLFWVALRLGSSETAAMFAAVGLGLASPIWAYAVLFWGHALAGSCLIFAFAGALQLRERRSSQRDLLLGLAVGLAAGWATVTEYPALPGSAAVALLALAPLYKATPRRWNAVAGLAAGTAVCIAILLVYQKIAFGSALHPSYSYYQNGDFPWMKRGYMGLTYPHPDVVLKLLFGCRRGLLFAAPVLAAAPFGLAILYKPSATRGPAIAAAFIALWYFLFNASFYVWSGGWSYGPRYLGAGIPLLCVGLAPAWDRATRHWRQLLTGLALASVAFSLMAVSTTPQPPDEFHCPLKQVIWPAFRAGNLSLNQDSMLTLAEEATLDTSGAFNLGELAGLHGLPSLIPLLLIWAIAALFWRRGAKP